MPRRLLLCLALGLALLAPAAPIAAHKERPSEFPSGEGSVPVYRTSGPRIVVCKEEQTEREISRLPPPLERRNERLLEVCREDGYRSIQAAIDHVRKPGTRILVQPGIYREQRSLTPPQGECADLDPNGILSYEEQRACPHLQNLVAVFGDGPDEDRACDGPLCRLQLEGTGKRPTDVIIENDFNQLNALRADRADGVYFRNFTVQHAEFNALYVIETDGFAIDRMVGRWNDEYGFLTFSSDHGLYVNCEAYGNGDGGLYPGSAADLHGARPSIEITGCRSHHNLIGYSGTAGNSTYVHDNVFDHNTTGVTMDSLFPDHPGLPQDAATFRNNHIFSNNEDYYGYIRDGTCDKPLRERGYDQGVVCPAFGVPIGTGILIAGGNANTFEGNYIYDNWRWGTTQFWVPAALREEFDPTKQFDTSHDNRYLGNRMGISASGEVFPNGLDFWWDEEGGGNCWEGNVPAPGRDITSDPTPLPDCSSPSPNLHGDPAKTALLGPCATWSRDNPDPPGCDWFEKPPPPS
jgi:hypothetical protein